MLTARKAAFSNSSVITRKGRVIAPSVRCQAKSEKANWASVLLAGAITVSAFTGVPQVLAAVSTSEPAIEQVSKAELQKQKLAIQDYEVLQREIVQNAFMASQRQKLASQASQIENSIDAKIIEERANRVVAEASGDPKRVQNVMEAEQNLEKEKLKVKAAVANVELAFSRAEMLDKVQKISNQQKAMRQALAATAASSAATTRAPAIAAMK